MPEIIIYTDGACRGNPGPGGWGAVLESGSHYREMYGSNANTTNNRMELLATIEALTAIKSAKSSIKLYTDSVYVKNGMTQWLPNWKKNGWKTASKKPVKNSDLWLALDQVQRRHDIEWLWVKGHAGHPGNEKADQLANRAIDEMLDQKPEQEGQQAG
jgi:ribonuclease HI